ncbi:hypothetical protein NC653_007172 [Populus alba x Populus x berolinensis]|uniref:Uncharacterized protein n=1 Tax=Populus alba x Populus x berolinensis TaxID=444605 RepID=A0AAD6WE10_9ROSI|nr:hypothetical protein NC653_007172 [Populus alba x Populus x berolinensis]
MSLQCDAFLDSEAVKTKHKPLNRNMVSKRPATLVSDRIGHQVPIKNKQSSSQTRAEDKQRSNLYRSKIVPALRSIHLLVLM